MDEFDSRNDRGSLDIVAKPVLTFSWHYEITGTAFPQAGDVGKISGISLQPSDTVEH